MKALTPLRFTGDVEDNEDGTFTVDMADSRNINEIHVRIGKDFTTYRPHGDDRDEWRMKYARRLAKDLGGEVIVAPGTTVVSSPKGKVLREEVFTDIAVRVPNA